MLALELLQYIKGNMEGVGTVSVPFHISQINKAITELIIFQAKNKQLNEALKSICSRCSHLETVQLALKETNDQKTNQS